MVYSIVNSDALTIEHVGFYAKLHATADLDGMAITCQTIGVITSVEHRKGAEGQLETAVTVHLGVGTATYVLDGSFLHLGGSIEDLAGPTPGSTTPGSTTPGST